MKPFLLNIKGVEVAYSTDDPKVHAWFYPRYAGGLVHEPALTYRLLDEVGDSASFVDVGAFVGYYTCLVAKASRGVVHAFEMDSHNVELLRSNIALNELDNVVIHHAAVADKSGRGTYMRGGDGYGAGHRLMRRDDRSLFRRALSRVLRQRSTDVVVLDDVLTEKPDVVKIDVEGAELAVLHGMRQILTGSPRLFIELHPPASQQLYGHSPDDVVSLLRESGFETYEVGEFRENDRSPLVPLEVPTGLVQNSLLFAVKGDKKTLDL